jgi:hypothetical protein
MIIMEKKLYTRPTISETKLDTDINLVLMSVVITPPEDPGFINPLKWFKK